MSDSKSSGPAAAIQAFLTRDRAIGLGTILAAFFAAVAISWSSKEAIEPVFSQPPEPATKVGLPASFPNALKPLELLELARSLTPRDQLVGIRVTGVKPDGTVDVSQTGSLIRFVFQSQKGQGPVPKRPAGTLPRRHYCGTQAVEITREGIGAQDDRPRSSCKSAIEALPAPTCSLAALWSVAKQRRIDDETAAVDYYRAEAGPAWRFTPENAGDKFVLAADCSTELKAKDTVGRVP